MRIGITLLSVTDSVSHPYSEACTGASAATVLASAGSTPTVRTKVCVFALLPDDARRRTCPRLLFILLAMRVSHDAVMQSRARVVYVTFNYLNKTTVASWI
jgi:hypothetical protein